MHLQIFPLLLLTLFTTTAFAIPFSTVSISKLLIRQTTQPATTVTCADYSQTANYTAIGSNSTLRAAFIQSSPAGTDPTRSILDTAVKRYTALNMLKDERLNRECGNLTTIALAEVGRNFTRGVVGGFPLKLTKVTFAIESAADHVLSGNLWNVLLMGALVGMGVVAL